MKRVVITGIGAVTPIGNNINDYCLDMNVPQYVKDFLLSEQATKFLSQYTNGSQLREVLSALCDGYSNGILTRESGNFRRDEDGDNLIYNSFYLR